MHKKKKKRNENEDEEQAQKENKEHMNKKKEKKRNENEEREQKENENENEEREQKEKENKVTKQTRKPSSKRTRPLVKWKSYEICALARTRAETCACLARETSFHCPTRTTVRLCKPTESANSKRHKQGAKAQQLLEQSNDSTKQSANTRQSVPTPPRTGLVAEREARIQHKIEVALLAAVESTTPMLLFLIRSLRLPNLLSRCEERLSVFSLLLLVASRVHQVSGTLCVRRGGTQALVGVFVAIALHSIDASHLIVPRRRR
jgi:hypothetical protein